MFFVYILFCVDGKLYVGYTTDLRRRLEEHCLGRVPSTTRRRPVKLLYYERYYNGRDAKAREVYLKSGAGHRELKKQHQHQLKILGYRYL
jgi:putative endonuclease